MFINTGGLPEHHDGKLHLQRQRHHHGHRHLQRFSQHHRLPDRSRCVAARRHLLLPGPRGRGSLTPAALLLKKDPLAASLFSASTLFTTFHLVITRSPSLSSLSPPPYETT